MTFDDEYRFNALHKYQTLQQSDLSMVIDINWKFKSFIPLRLLSEGTDLALITIYPYILD